MKRVAVYVDGFNLYHAIDKLNKPYLKWLDLTALGLSLCRGNEQLVKTCYFSAYATWIPEAYARHRHYVAALKARSVECHMARFSVKAARCRTCGSTWTKHEEKETDVHFSLTLLEDAIDDHFDRAIVISADSDHVPAIRRVRARFPVKEVFVATPPGRYRQARDLLTVCNSGIEITQGRLAQCLLTEVIKDETGHTLATRPQAYDPPSVI